MISRQAMVFLYSIIVGSFLTFVFDIFRIIRKNFKTPNYMVAIQDIIFFLIVLITIISTSFIYNNGEIRGYMIMGYLLGLMLYLLLLHRIISIVIGGMLNIIKKAAIGFLKILKNMTSRQKNLKKS